MQDTLNCSGLLTGNLMIVPKGTLNVRAHATGKTLRLTFVEPSSGMFSPRKERKNEVRTPHRHLKMSDDSRLGMLWCQIGNSAFLPYFVSWYMPRMSLSCLKRRQEVSLAYHKP